MLKQLIEKRPRDLGGGMTVGRVLPIAQQRSVGPFVFFDHIGPIHLPAGIPQNLDVRPHPHIGLSTVTYLFDGEIMHRDSVGSEQAICPGEMNWMTAGSGITHSERFERARAQGGGLHGIQSWVALPESEEECAPAFSHHPLADLPEFTDSGVWARLIAGEALGGRAAVDVRSPLFYIHTVLQPGARFVVPPGYSERAAYLVSGAIEFDGQRFEAGHMLVFDEGSSAVIRAVTAAVLMVLGGEPLGVRYMEWNFVSSSRERIEQAKADWQAGRMKLPDLDHQEFIPLPVEPKPPQPMS